MRRLRRGGRRRSGRRWSIRSCTCKRHFGYAKVRYRGLAKNTQRLVLLLGLTNLMTAERLAA